MALSTTTDVSELRLIDALVRTNALALASRQPDVSLSGRVHETFQQYHAGVPVYGGGISRQLANTGLTVSIFGTIYQAIRPRHDASARPARGTRPRRTASRRRPGHRHVDYPSAAASIREGLDETLTVVELQLSERLRRSLATTNAVESLLSRTRHVKRNVKRLARGYDGAPLARLPVCWKRPKDSGG